MGKTKIIRKLKRREYKWKTDQYEVDNPANGSEDMFDVIPGNEKKKNECASWRAHRRIWDRLLSPSFAIECQGLRETYSSI